MFGMKMFLKIFILSLLGVCYLKKTKTRLLQKIKVLDLFKYGMPICINYIINDCDD